MRVYFNPLCVGGGQGRRPLTQIKRLLLLCMVSLYGSPKGGVGRRRQLARLSLSLFLSVFFCPIHRSASLLVGLSTFLLCWTPYSSLLPGFMARLRRRSNHSLSSVLFALGLSLIPPVSPAVERLARSHASLSLLLEC